MTDRENRPAGARAMFKGKVIGGPYDGQVIESAVPFLRAPPDWQRSVDDPIGGPAPTNAAPVTLYRFIDGEWRVADA